MGNLFEAHKYGFTIPMHEKRAYKKRIAELERQVAILERMLDAAYRSNRPKS